MTAFLRRRCRALALMVSLFPLLGHTTFALDSSDALVELHHTRWTSHEGAPGEITAIAQTTDGFLWLACADGLYRFDGERFELFTLANGSHPITEAATALLGLPGNDLLVGMRFGGAFLLHAGHVTAYGKGQGLPDRSVTAFAVRGDGSWWAQTTAGLYRFDSVHWSRVGADWNYPAKVGWFLTMSRNGTLWSRSGDGTFYLPPNATSFNKSPVPGGQGKIAECADGNLWMSDADLGLMVLTEPLRPIQGTALGGGNIATNSLFCDREGGLWTHIEANRKLSLVKIADVAGFAKNGYRMTSAEAELSRLTPTDAAYGIWSTTFEDREGNIWIGTINGLDRFRRNKLHAALRSTPMASPALAVSKQGNVWLSDGSTLVEFSPNRVAPTVAKSLTGEFVYSLWSDTDDSVWIGYSGGRPVHLRNQELITEQPPPGHYQYGINGIARDAAGSLWIANIGNGLFRQDSRGWTLNGGLIDLPEAPPTSLTADDRGRLWLGYTNSRVAEIENGKARMLPNSNELSVGPVTVVTVHRDRVWLGGPSNVALYLNDHFRTLTSPDGTGFKGVSGIVASNDGALWLNGSAGVTHIPADEVRAFVEDPAHRVKAETMTYEDGLDGAPPSLRPVPSARQDGAGRIWFVTSTGAYWIDPQRIPRNPLAPPVLVKSILVDGKNFLGPDSATLPVLTSNIEIDYAATSLSIPSRVRFKYKLDGVDAQWQDVGPRRQAYYTRVPPGEHQFHVVAANEDGVWNEAGATVAFLIPLAFYQTRWFSALCGLAVLALLWQAYRLRLRQVRARLMERIGERERIARELHDTLIQSAQGLILQFQGLGGQLPKADPMRQKMEAALDQADDVLNEARARVSGLRTSSLEGDIVQALRRAGEEIFANESVQFSVTSAGVKGPLTEDIANEIYRIGREALLNAAAHARAHVVEVMASFEKNGFRLTIRDDGCGVSSAVLQAGSRRHHFGLQGMRERALRIGAQFDIRSPPGAGTEVALLLPATAAYRKPRLKWRWLANLVSG
jgi:signal transduction histidine kinase/ligand-binding sensor domain-containing protein